MTLSLCILVGIALAKDLFGKHLTLGPCRLAIVLLKTSSQS